MHELLVAFFAPLRPLRETFAPLLGLFTDHFLFHEQ